MILSKKRIIKALISLRGRAGWVAPLLFANPERQIFSRRGPYKRIFTNHLYIFYPQDLRLLHLTCCGLSEPDWVELAQIRHRYQPMITERNICFKITTDLIIEPDAI